MEKSKSSFVAQAGIIAALYVVLSLLIGSVGLANGVIQFRISEALCVLPIFTPAAIPGLFVGCLLSNILTGCVLWDIIFGSLTTLICAFLTGKLKNKKILNLIPPILGNAIVVPFVLKYAYGMGDAIWFMFLTVGAGEGICIGILGSVLIPIIRRYGKYMGIS